MVTTANITPIERMLETFDAKPSGSGGWYATRCTAHDDQRSSLSFIENENGSIKIQCFAGCEWETILSTAGLKPADLYPRNGYKPQYKPRPKLDVVTLAFDKLIPWQYLFNEYGLEDGYKWHGQSCCRIPYYTETGELHTKARVRIKLSGNRGSFWDEDTPGSSIPYGLHKLDMAREQGYLLLGEGESDGWTCWMYGIPYLGVPGATNTNCLQGEMLSGIPRVYIIQEPDGAGQQLYSRVHKQLRHTNYTGEIYSLQFKKLTGRKDPNDLHKHLKGKGVKEKILSAISQAIPSGDLELHENNTDKEQPTLDQAIAQKDLTALFRSCSILAQLSRAEYAIYKKQIKDAFGKDINLNDLDAAVNEKKQLSTPDNNGTFDADSVALIFKERHFENWRFDVEGPTWREWVGTHWLEQEKNKNGKYEIDLLLKTIIHELGFDIKSNGILDVSHRLAEGECRATFQTLPNLINFKNGTLRLPDLNLKKHDKNDGFLYCLDYDYDPLAKHPTIDHYLQETFCKKELDEIGRKIPDWHVIQAYEAHIGLALIGDTAMNAYEILFGPTRSGKSTALRLANAACGVAIPGETTVEKMYSSFAGDDLFLNELEGKRARYQRRYQRIVCADELSPDALKQEEMIKNMSAHSGVPMRGMNRDDVVNNVWTPKIIMSTNNMPHYLDYASAVKERTIFLLAPFRREQEERDLKLLSKLIGELPGFTHTCITLGLAAIERGYYPQSMAMKELANVAESSGNALKSFVEECCALDPQAITPSMIIYKAFLVYREDNGHGKKFAQPTMTSSLKSMNIGVHNNDGKATRIYDGSDGTPKKCLFGIRLSDSEEETPQKKLVDDRLLDPSCNGLVTDCNGPVTDMRYKNDGSSDGSTGQFNSSHSSACNDVTMFLEKVDKGNPPPFKVNPDTYAF